MLFDVIFTCVLEMQIHIFGIIYLQLYVTYAVYLQAVPLSSILQLVAQVTVNLLRLRQKISLSMMTCVQCVTNGFTNKKYLNAHRWIHTEENVYTCSVCEESFSSNRGLRDNKNIHTGRYKCTECGKCFQDSSDLAIHRRSHSAEKSFECSVCSKRFAQQSSRETNHTNVTCVTRRLVSLEV